MMRLITLHGRHSPAEDMEDWGFDGPTIEGIKAVHYTYGSPAVFFATQEACEAARKLTGWGFFDAHALRMDFHEDLLKISPEGAPAQYFGDWELQDSPEAQALSPEVRQVWLHLPSFGWYQFEVEGSSWSVVSWRDVHFEDLPHDRPMEEVWDSFNCEAEEALEGIGLL